jgi:enoyl-CoA hydratase
MVDSCITLVKTGDIATLTLGRAKCLDAAGQEVLTQMLRCLGNDIGTTRVLILCATHPSAWLVNVQELADLSALQARDFSHRGHELVAALLDLPVPVVAVVDAPALGGGCELVLACDLAFAGEKASFGQIEAQGGVMPAFGGTWRLEERVGRQRALAMMFTAEVVNATTAKQYGIVLEAHLSTEVLGAARQLAQQVAACSMESVAAIKRATRAGRGLPVAALNALEEEAFALLFGPEQQRRMHSFLDQQKTH